MKERQTWDNATENGLIRMLNKMKDPAKLNRFYRWAEVEDNFMLKSSIEMHKIKLIKYLETGVPLVGFQLDHKEAFIKVARAPDHFSINRQAKHDKKQEKKKEKIQRILDELEHERSLDF